LPQSRQGCDHQQRQYHVKFLQAGAPQKQDQGDRSQPNHGGGDIDLIQVQEQIDGASDAISSFTGVSGQRTELS